MTWQPHQTQNPAHSIQQKLSVDHRRPCQCCATGEIWSGSGKSRSPIDQGRRGGGIVRPSAFAILRSKTTLSWSARAAWVRQLGFFIPSLWDKIHHARVQFVDSMKPPISNIAFTPSDLILKRRRSWRGRLQGWPRARSRLVAVLRDARILRQAQERAPQGEVV